MSHPRDEVLLLKFSVEIDEIGRIAVARTRTGGSRGGRKVGARTRGDSEVALGVWNSARRATLGLGAIDEVIGSSAGCHGDVRMERGKELGYGRNETGVGELEVGLEVKLPSSGGDLELPATAGGNGVDMLESSSSRLDRLTVLDVKGDAIATSTRGGGYTTGQISTGPILERWEVKK